MLKFFFSSVSEGLTTYLCVAGAMAGSREDSPDYEVGYIAEDHPLRPMSSTAQQSIRLLKVPSRQGAPRSRTASISSSVTDLDAPIYRRETAGGQHVSTCTGKNKRTITILYHIVS